MARGGYRPGSGRKRGFKFPRTMKLEQAKALATEQILQNLSPLLTAQLEMALGEYYYEKVDGATGVKKIYRGRPNLSAIQAVIEFAFGKPKQPVDGKFEGTFETPGMEIIADKLQQLLDSKKRRTPVKATAAPVKSEQQQITQPQPVPASMTTPSPNPKAIPVTPVQEPAPPSDTKPAPIGINPVTVLSNNGSNTNAGAS